METQVDRASNIGFGWFQVLQYKLLSLIIVSGGPIRVVSPTLSQCPPDQPGGIIHAME